MNETLRMKRGALLCLILCFTLLWGNAEAQSRTVSGTVKDGSTGEAIPGVSVLIKGTLTGTITDVNGNFSIQSNSDADVIVFSFVGYAKNEVAVAGKTTIDVTLAQDLTTLEEVVVVGYGEQKKSVVTGAISSVKASQLSNMPLTRVEQALQGRVSGVTIASNSGQPGSSATVRVRGITSTTEGANNPLWVIDGVVVDNGGIGYLNQADIESIEVLKDAASSAIYGTRAASGVILITTKKGKSGGIQVNYNGFYGISAPTRKLDLLNAEQYATMRNEAAGAAGKPLPFANPSALGAGTDWQSAVFNNSAKRQNHELSLSGGNDKSTFYASLGYLDQQGIVASPISNYTRVNFRINANHKISKYVTFGHNLGYAHTKSLSVGNTNSEFGGTLSSAINLDPTTPLIETDPAKFSVAPYTNVGAVKDANGNFYGLSNWVGQEMQNPLAYVKTHLGNNNQADDIVGNAFLEVEPIKGLKLRSNLGVKMAFWNSTGFTPIYYLAPTQITSQTSFNRQMNQVFNWTFENTASYTKTIGKHNFTALVGQGAYYDGAAKGLNVTYYGIPVDNFKDATLNYNVPNANRISSGYENLKHTLTSLFARVNYDYDEKYLLTAIIRQDASTRFGGNNKYGAFPSFSLGWVTSRENFWVQNNVVNFLKIRGGYGVVGNDAIGDLAYLSTIGGGRNYAIDNTGNYVSGYSPNAPANPNLAWEQTSQTNIGFESTLLQNFNLTFDWFTKKTTGMLQNPRIPKYVGAISDPAANVSDMKNTGYEIELGYKNRIGDVDFSLNGNVSHIKNTVTYLGRGMKVLPNGNQTFQASSYPISVTEVGQPVNSFYGFDMIGIFQTQEEVQSYQSAEGKVIQPGAKPGDVKWADLNGDGAINSEDRKILGNPFPKFTFGFTLTAAYKGFDLMVFGQGVSGNTIFQGLRRLDVQYANWQTEVLGRWTGAGSTNDYPRLVEGDPNKNFANPSRLYLEKGDYFRLKTVQLGYTLPKSIVSKVGLQKTRLYVMSENLATFTKYTGYDPEIGGNVMGIDRGYYPQARSLMFGLNLGF
jgi:TonB-linked SusC/RagA family outer membrane protein